MPRIAVIDLSHHNTIPENLLAAKAQGVMGVIHKATESTNFTDSKYQARRDLARQAGLMFGAYHFMRPGPVEDQVRYFLGKAQPDDDMLLACDYEDPGVQVGQLIAFMEMLEDLSNRHPVLYCGHVLKEQLKGKPQSELSKYRLWIAQYGPKPVLPPGWANYWLWQYTDGTSGPDPKKVNGVNAPVDCNDYDGDDEDLVIEWSGHGATPDEPAGGGDNGDDGEGPEQSVVHVRVVVDAPPDVKVNVEVTYAQDDNF